MGRYKEKYEKTNRLMSLALIQLLDVKDYHTITVNEICFKAGINRSTFYLHYENVDSLFSETISNYAKDFLGRFRSIVSLIDLKANDLNSLIMIRREYVMPYLEFVKEHSLFFRVLHKKQDLFEMHKLLNKLKNDYFFPIIERFNGEDGKNKYIIEFYLKGVISTALCWAENNCSEDIEIIYQTIVDCFNIKK